MEKQTVDTPSKPKEAVELIQSQIESLQNKLNRINLIKKSGL
ncbi:hypothetical protein O1D97_01950 [Marinomonas sp. 15G1-11]|uniref:Transposase n=1 Tax=Marinomonas phaeophyticola TaxID=3004091 RepID=A0ABT4JQ24_9GAMM|nr:hypothetical protein [Marinomonas sp. 15G1-11]MCZ2720439.1 hypothetical protein [Marinomonas sp. 15G1-11]